MEKKWIIGNDTGRTDRQTDRRTDGRTITEMREKAHKTIGPRRPDRSLLLKSTHHAASDTDSLPVIGSGGTLTQRGTGSPIDHRY